MLSVATTAFWLKRSFDEALVGFLKCNTMLLATFSFDAADHLNSIKQQAPR
jgi:hypothetical protein